MMLRRLAAALTALFLLTLSPLAAVDRAVPTSGTLSAILTDLNTELTTLYNTSYTLLGTVAGTNTITAVTTPSLTGYTDGQLFQIKPANNNTSTVTLNVNSLGGKAVVSASGTALSADDLQSTTIYFLRYYASSDHFRVMTQLGTGAAPASVPFVTIGNTGSLSAERALTAGTGMGLTDGGANSTATLNITDAELACILAQTSAADKISYWTGSGTCGLADFPSAFRTYLTTPTVANLAAVLSDEAAGWATFQATPSSANFASFVTGETGSGAVMFGTSPSITTDITIPNTGLHLLDTDASHDLVIVPGSNLTADRNLTLTTGDAARTVTISADATISGTNTGDDDVPEVGDFTNLVGGSGVDNNSGTIDADLTELNTVTFGSSTFTTLIFDAGATDPTWTYASNGVGLTNMATFVHGNATSLTTAGVAAQVQIDGTDSATGSLNINEHNTTDGTAFGLNFFKSGNASIGSSTVVANTEDLGRITWYGAQQTGTFATQNQAAGIRAVVGGVVTSGAGADMPGSLIFCTTPDASGTCTDRLTIDAAGLSTFAGNVTLGANSITTTNVELANGAANTLTAAAGVLSIEGAALATSASVTTAVTNKTESLCVAASDETTALTAAAGKVTFRMPYAFTVTDVRASVTTVATGATLLTVDVNESGTTIISTKLTFDASESTTTTAATPRVISDSALADDAQMSVDVDAIGNTTPGKGLKVCLIGHQ